MAEIRREPFSRRYSYKRPKEITVWEDAPERVRRTAVDKARSPIGPKRLLEIVCSVLKPQPERTDDAWNQVDRLMSSWRMVPCVRFHRGVLRGDGRIWRPTPNGLRRVVRAGNERMLRGGGYWLAIVER